MLLPAPAPLSTTLDATLLHAIDSKTKPLGSLGVLEQLALQLGRIQQTATPHISAPTLLVFAGDHGIAHEGVSAYPQDVTWQMVENFLAGGAAINVFARLHGWALQVVDAGVNHDFGVRPGLIDRKIGPGTRNFAHEAAMTPAQCEQALGAGAALGGAAPGNVVGFGEMGIANTTSAAALMHVLCGIALPECVGAGTGLSAEGVAHKLQVLQAAVARHGRADDPLATLATYGGFEIAMMAGAMLGAAQARKVLVVDGFIATSAVLVASALQPALLDYCVFAHRSGERGHARMLAHLGARPLLDLGLRLGEGSGCALALPILRSATAFVNEMATFAAAHVDERKG